MDQRRLLEKRQYLRAAFLHLSSADANTKLMPQIPRPFDTFGLHYRSYFPHQTNFLDSKRMQHQVRAVVAREQGRIPTRLTHKTPTLPTQRRITPLFGLRCSPQSIRRKTHRLG